MVDFPHKWRPLLAAACLTLAGSAQADSFRLVWDKPTNGAPVDFYSIYRVDRGAGKAEKLGDTTNCFWLIPSFSTNVPSAWRVTVHVGHFESDAAQLEFRPGTSKGPSEAIVATTRLLVNGGFEEKTEGWRFAGDCSISASPGAIVPAEGKRCVVFNLGQRSERGEVSQTFQTVRGAAYQVAFQAGVIAFERKKAEERMVVTAQGSAKLAEKQITLRPASRNKADFTAETMRFVADSDQTTLTFRDASTPDSRVHLLLDNVHARPAE